MAGVTGKDGQKGRVFARDPDRKGLAEEAQDSTGEPKPKAKTNGGGERPVEDGKAARRAAQKHRLGQRAVQRHYEAWNG
jgi:hypothetical protein